MSSKKIFLDLDGKLKEESGIVVDTDANSLVANKINISTASIGSDNGLLVSENGVLSVISADIDGKVLVSDGTKWTTVEPNYAGSVPTSNPVIGDLDPNSQFPDPIVKNLSNVRKGVLSIANGGTGVGTYPSAGEVLFVGDNTATPALLNALSASDGQALYYDGSGWGFRNVPGGLDKIPNVQIFSGSGTYTWNKPADTKYIRILAHGGGGGGGSGANRNSAVIAMGGGGGASGGFANATMFIDDSVTSGTVVVGAGGPGGVTPPTGSNGISGGDGSASSFTIGSNTLVTATGGTRGIGGLLNNSTATAGGTAGAASTTLYDNYLDANTVSSGIAGATSTATVGSNNTFSTSSTPSYYGAPSGGGGGGGSLAASNYITNYVGGNGGSTVANGGNITTLNAASAITSSLTTNNNLKNKLYISSGGGGGASAKFTGSINDFYKIEEPISSSAVFVLDGLFDYYGQYTREMINNITINRVGNASIVTANHLGTGSGSFYFNPTTTTNGLNFSINKNIGTGDFTIEFWVYITNTTNTHYIFDMRDTVSDGRNAIITINPTSATFGIYGNIGGGITSLSSVSVNTWTHLAFVRQAGVVYLYKDGILDNSGAFTNRLDNNTSVTNWIGYSGFFVASGRILAGYLDRIRIYRSAIYTGNFTPSTLLYKNHNPQYVLGGIGSNGLYGAGGGGGGASTNYTSSNLNTSDLETALLLHYNQSDINSIKDYSPYRNTAITSSDCTIIPSPVGVPFNSPAFSDNYVLSSSNTNSSGQILLQTSTNNSIQFGTGNFVAEGWYYIASTGSSAPNSTYYAFLYQLGIGDSPNLLGLALSGSTNEIKVYTTGIYYNTNLTLSLNTWNHIAFVRGSSTNCNVILNGTASANITIPAATTTNGFFSMGSTLNFNPHGYMKEFKVTNVSSSNTLQNIQDYYSSVVSGLSGSYTDPNPGVQQGGNGGDGYVAIVSYK